MQSAQCRVHSAECRVQSAQCRVHSAECTVQSAQCTVSCLFVFFGEIGKRFSLAKNNPLHGMGYGSAGMEWGYDPERQWDLQS